MDQEASNTSGGKSLIVRINDRDPYPNKGLIDVSSEAAKLVEFRSVGIARVRVEYVSRAPLKGSETTAS